MLCVNVAEEARIRNEQKAKTKIVTTVKLPIGKSKEITMQPQAETEIIDPEKTGFASIARKLLIMILLFFLSAYGMYLLVQLAPQLPPDQKELLWNKVPSSWKDRAKLTDLRNIKDIFMILDNYKDQHPIILVALLAGFYLFYQTFPIFLFWCPGTASGLTMLIGALYGRMTGVSVCCVLSTLGPCLAYGMFGFAGRPVLQWLFGLRLQKYERLVGRRTSGTGELLAYIIFLRLTPLFPNFFINVASPILNIPLKQFILGTCLGLLPNTIALGIYINSNIFLCLGHM